MIRTRPILLLAAFAAAALGTACATKSSAPAAAEAAAVQTFAVTPEISAALAAAKPGDAVLLPGIDLESAPSLAYDKVVLNGAQYMISDDPEYIRVPEAIGLQEKVEPGLVRLYTYNVNGVKEPAHIDRRINTVIRNLGDAPLTVTFTHFSGQAPSTNYFGVAKNSLREYLEGRSAPGFTIPVGGAVPLDAAQEKAIVKFDELVHGIYEFTIDQPAQITVVQTSLDRSSVDAANDPNVAILPPKSRSGAGRGLFQISDYRISLAQDVKLDTANGPAKIVVADGKTDPWALGIDGSTGKVAALKGNYGIFYHMEIERSSSDGRAMALVTWNARAGSQWCGAMANVVEVSDGIHPGGIIDVPTGKLVTKEAPEAVVIQVFPPLPAGETETIRLVYSPPGASCLPTPLVFVPIDLPK